MYSEKCSYIETLKTINRERNKLKSQVSGEVGECAQTQVSEDLEERRRRRRRSGRRRKGDNFSTFHERDQSMQLAS